MIYVEIFGQQVNLYAQIVGFVGLVVIAWSYQLKKLGYLAVSTVAMAIFLAESCILYADSDTFTGIVLNAAAVVRNLLMILFLRRYGREMPAWVAVCLLVPVWIICVFGFGAWYTYLPPALQTVYIFCALSKNYYCLKGGALVLEGGNLFYNASVGAYVGILRQVVLVTSVIVSTIVYFVHSRRERAANAAEAPRS